MLSFTNSQIGLYSAGLLNTTFNTDAIADQLLVGIATITVNTK
jgi:hypothetical protein